MPKKYNLKINIELKNVFEEYYKEHPELGFRSLSEYLNKVLRDKAMEILESKKNK